jgi:hypothetical protein
VSPNQIGPDTLRLEYFDLGSTIDVPCDLFRSVTHPRSSKELGILSIRESAHEFVPKRAGNHGILYTHHSDLPSWIVRPRLS